MAESKMKILIDDLKTGLELAITNSVITKADKVYKGITQDPAQIKSYKFISLNDSGERVELAAVDQKRFYSVLFDMSYYSTNIETALDGILDLTQEVKDWLELLSTKTYLKVNNSELDGHIWGINIIPYEWNEENYFYRGRSVIVDFWELEEQIFDY